MQLQQRQSPALHPLTTAHLAQTMSLLELPTVELRQKILPWSLLKPNVALTATECWMEPEPVHSALGIWKGIRNNP